jgi:hypothetical protein
MRLKHVIVEDILSIQLSMCMHRCNHAGVKRVLDASFCTINIEQHAFLCVWCTYPLPCDQ